MIGQINQKHRKEGINLGSGVGEHSWRREGGRGSAKSGEGSSAKHFGIVVEDDIFINGKLVIYCPGPGLIAGPCNAHQESFALCVAN